MTVTTAPGCRWRPDVLANPWLHVENDAIFAGPATLALTIDGNRSFSGRTGTVAIRDANGEVATSQPLTQRGAGCLYSVEPTARTFDWLGTSDGSDLGLLSLRVHAEPADCRWTATPSVPWILILNRTGSGTGDGDVDVAILHNSLPSGEFPGPRAGQLVVAGLSGVNPDARFTASQQAR